MRVLKYVIYILFIASIVFGVGLLARIFIYDSFIVRGSSMEPTFNDGERVWVNKLKMGARIYTDFDFESPQLRCFRMPGLRRMKAGDVVVINDPYFRCRDSITFTINHVYLKRCYGCPGDIVRIVNGYYIHPDTGRACGPLFFQDQLSELGDSLLRSMGVYVNAWNVNKREGWTILDFGPLYVPKKGEKISLTPDNYRNYRRQIHYETGKWIVEDEGNIVMDGKIVQEYEFNEDWCFLGGDNVLNSRDSRYVGFMPKAFVIGIVK